MLRFHFSISMKKVSLVNLQLFFYSEICLVPFVFDGFFKQFLEFLSFVLFNWFF